MPFTDAKAAVKAGRNSGMLEWCNFDAKANYASFMKYERAKNTWNDKQLAYLSLMHGITQGHVVQSNRKTKGNCPEEKRQQIQDQLSKAQ